MVMDIGGIFLQIEVNQWEALVNAFYALWTPKILALMLVGLIIGIVLGAIPGLGAVLGMTIVLPLTILLDGTGAAVILISIYSGALYGSSISAILINVPGTSASAATTFDGYTMTRAGKSLEALELSATSSAVGGFLTILLLLVLVPWLQPIILMFNPPEIFILAIFGIVMVAVIAAQGDFLKGFVSGWFGLLIMTIGVAQTKPIPRYTFDILTLYNGLNFVAILIGMFALGEMFRIVTLPGSVVDKGREITGERYRGFKTTFENWLFMIKHSMIGMVIGAIPGVGAGTSNFVAYAEAIRSSSTPEKYGNAYPPGVIASEASNNGTVAGSVMPVLAFGIPGSASTAVLLGGFIMHGITPGIEMFTIHLELTYTMILALLLGNIVILVVGMFLVTEIGTWITKIDTDIIIPIIMVFAIIGALGIRKSWLDVATVFVFGVIAFYMNIFDYSTIALVLGAVLSAIIEDNLVQSMQMSHGNLGIFFSSPLALFMWAAMLVFMYASFTDQIKNIAATLLNLLPGTDYRLRSE